MQTLFAASVSLCLVLSLGHAASLFKPGLQREHCSWGAQYWCSSTETADLCGKAEWCALNDWPYDVAQDLPCMVVQQIIKNTRILIGKSAEKPVTEYDFAMLLARSCTFFNDDKERQKCKELVTSKDVLPKLVKLVDSKLSVKSVASAVGVCQKNIPKDKPCLRCSEMVSSVQKLISKFLTQDLYMKFVEPQCVKLGQGHHLCRSMAQAKYQDFLDGLINAPTASVCKDMTQCLGVLPHLQSVQSSDECETCKFVVKEIRELDRSQGVQTVLQNLIKSVCGQLGDFAQLCDTLADEGLQYLSELIATEMEPDVVCEELKLCGQPEKKAVQASSLDGATVACEICEIIFEEIDKAIGSNYTEDELKNLLIQDFCDRLPTPFNGQCTAFVTQYSDQIIKILLTEVNPQLICTTLGLCKNATNVLQIKQKIAMSGQQSNNTCALCKYVVTFLDTFLQKNATEAEIEALLDRACDLLPENYSQECIVLVKQYGPLIIQMLVAELKPEQVCLALKLCAANKPALSQVKAQPKQPNDEICDICKYVFTYLDTWLDKNSTQAEIEAALDEVCRILPANWSQQCESLVQSYAPLIIQLLIGELQPEEICKRLNYCPTNKQAPKTQKPSSALQKGELCPLCLLVFEEIYAILEKNSTEEEIKAAFDEVCDFLPATIKDQCLSFVALYLPYVIDLIVQELPPNQICHELGLCNATMGQAMKPTHSLHVNRGSAVKAGELCTLCIYVFEALDVILPQNRTEAEIEAALDQVCKYLSTYEDQCKNFVALYTPFVIDMVTKKFTPQQICNALGLCSNSTSTKLHTPANLKLSAGPQCALCEYVIKYLDDELGQNATEKEIEAALEKVCSLVPSTLKTDCEAFIANYTAELLKILKTLPPDQVCTYLGLCSSQVKGKLIIATNLKILSSGAECALCEYVVKYLASQLTQNATEQQIEAALDQVCSLLPSTLSAECEAFVNEYTPQLLILLKTLIPSQVCSYLGLCSNQVKVKLHSPVNARKFSDGPQCALCEYVIKYLDTILNENATEEQIQEALDKVCSLLPSSMKSACDTFIAQYTPQLLKLLQSVPPDQVCSYLGLCSSQVKAKHHILAKLKKLSGEPQCALCDFVVKYLDSILTKNATEQEIEAALDQMCNLMPSYLKSECVTFIDDYIPTVLELLKTLSPDQVCSYLELCSSQVKALKAPPAPLMFAPETTTTTTPTTTAPYMPQCSDCKFILYDIQTALVNSPFWQNTTRDIFNVLCTYLRTGQDLCQHLVNINFQHVINTVEDFNFPMVFCQQIDLCEPPEQVETVTRCSSCKIVVQMLKSKSHQVTSPVEMNALADSTCNLTSTNAASQCKTILKNRMPQIVQLMKTNSDPASVCEAASLCKRDFGDVLNTLLETLGL